MAVKINRSKGRVSSTMAKRHKARRRDRDFYSDKAKTFEKAGYDKKIVALHKALSADSEKLRKTEIADHKRKLAKKRAAKKK